MTFAFPPALIIAALVLPLSIALFFWKTRWTRLQLSAVIAPRLRDHSRVPLIGPGDVGRRSCSSRLSFSC